MFIDIVFAILMIVAAFNGFRRGFIVAIFSVLGLIVGLAAALKLSTVVAGYLKDSTNISHQWLPVVSFLIVLIIVILLMRLIANFLQKTMEFAFLGWLNRLGGIILYMAVYTIIFSVILFFAVQIKIIREDAIAESKTYSWVQPWGPNVINEFGKMIPIFNNMFTQLEEFFTRLSRRLS